MNRQETIYKKWEVYFLWKIVEKYTVVCYNSAD